MSSRSSDERRLDIGQQHRELGPGQALARLRARGQRLVVGQELDRAVEPLRALELAHQPHVPVEARSALVLLEREGEALQVIVAQHQRRHLVGHGVQQLVALLHREVARGDRGVRAGS